MPFKLILFILLLVIAAVFTGLNLENACDINFGFRRFEQVPVFLTILFSFLAGVLMTLPFTFGKRRGTRPVKTEKVGLFKKEKKVKSGAEKTFRPGTGTSDGAFSVSDSPRENADSKKDIP